jgi:5'-methylthioadenosine phosphorylase
MIKIGLITGTGFYSLPNLRETKKEIIATPFGSVNVELGEVAGRDVVFIPRHGKEHTISPSNINYRANIFALNKMGVKIILATAVSGSLNIDWGPGTFVLLEQFLDFTYGREYTFYPMNGNLAHIDVTDPYCKKTHHYIKIAAKELNIDLRRGGVYSCFNGPRFETRAEIKMVKMLGGNLVGQTGFPECVLARELAMSYASVAIVSNLAAGIAAAELTATEIMENLHNLGDQVAQLFQRTIELIPENFDSQALHALDHAYL